MRRVVGCHRRPAVTTLYTVSHDVYFLMGKVLLMAKGRWIILTIVLELCNVSVGAILRKTTKLIYPSIFVGNFPGSVSCKTPIQIAACPHPHFKGANLCYKWVCVHVSGMTVITTTWRASQATLFPSHLHDSFVHSLINSFILSSLNSTYTLYSFFQQMFWSSTKYKGHSPF